MPPERAERLDHFMARANAAYYDGQDYTTDFATAPEISQVFGELLGGWLAASWQALGCPAPVALAECGPGSGRLMADITRTLAAICPELHRAAQICLVETAPRLRALQAARVPEARFFDEPASLPDQPLLLVANEFLDALPIRQFIRTPSGWDERYVEGGKPVLRPCDLPPDAAAPGTVRERGEAALAFAHWLGGRVAACPAAALLIDYGPRYSADGESLQSIRQGRPADPFAEPVGGADLTAHVAFAALASMAAAAGAHVAGPVGQGRFLAELGLFPRARRLAARAEPAQALAMMRAASRLAEPTAMGELFKVMSIHHPACAALPGFSP